MSRSNICLHFVCCPDPNFRVICNSLIFRYILWAWRSVLYLNMRSLWPWSCHVKNYFIIDRVSRAKWRGIGFSSLKQQYLILNIRYINKIMVYSPFYFYKCSEKILKNTVFKSTFFSRCILIYDIYSLHADFDTFQKI